MAQFSLGLFLYEANMDTNTKNEDYSASETWQKVLWISTEKFTVWKK